MLDPRIVEFVGEVEGFDIRSLLHRLTGDHAGVRVERLTNDVFRTGRASRNGVLGAAPNFQLIGSRRDDRWSWSRQVVQRRPGTSRVEIVERGHSACGAGDTGVGHRDHLATLGESDDQVVDVEAFVVVVDSALSRDIHVIQDV